MRACVRDWVWLVSFETLFVAMVAYRSADLSAVTNHTLILLLTLNLLK